jgi:hypothetical protein
MAGQAGHDGKRLSGPIGHQEKRQAFGLPFSVK